MTSPYMKNLRLQPGVKISPVREAVLDLLEQDADQVAAMVGRFRRGRIDRPIRVALSDLDRKLGSVKAIKADALSEARVQLHELLRAGARHAVVSRMTPGASAVKRYASVLVTAVDPPPPTSTEVASRWTQLFKNANFGPLAGNPVEEYVATAEPVWGGAADELWVGAYDLGPTSDVGDIIAGGIISGTGVGRNEGTLIQPSKGFVPSMNVQLTAGPGEGIQTELFFSFGQFGTVGESTFTVLLGPVGSPTDSSLTVRVSSNPVDANHLTTFTLQSSPGVSEVRTFSGANNSVLGRQLYIEITSNSATNTTLIDAGWYDYYVAASGPVPTNYLYEEVPISFMPAGMGWSYEVSGGSGSILEWVNSEVSVVSA